MSLDLVCTGAFKHAQLLRVPFCVSWAFLVKSTVGYDLIQ